MKLRPKSWTPITVFLFIVMFLAALNIGFHSGADAAFGMVAPITSSSILRALESTDSSSVVMNRRMLQSELDIQIYNWYNYSQGRRPWYEFTQYLEPNLGKTDHGVRTMSRVARYRRDTVGPLLREESDAYQYLMKYLPADSLAKP